MQSPVTASTDHPGKGVLVGCGREGAACAWSHQHRALTIRFCPPMQGPGCGAVHHSTSVTPAATTEVGPAGDRETAQLGLLDQEHTMQQVVRRAMECKQPINQARAGPTTKPAITRGSVTCDNDRDQGYEDWRCCMSPNSWPSSRGWQGHYGSGPQALGQAHTSLTKEETACRDLAVGTVSGQGSRDWQQPVGKRESPLPREREREVEAGNPNL